MDGLPERIAYIDDDADLRQLVREKVEHEDLETALAICGSGEEFFLRVRVLQPELVLLDLKMPDMDGPSVLERMQLIEETKGMPVVFMTGVKDVEMIRDYKQLGVIGVIHKPFNIDTFLEDVAKIWQDFKAEDEEA